jgi:hypothetical protein
VISYIQFDIYRITSVLKVETDIITTISANPTGRAVILVIMYVKIFKTDVIVFIGDVKMCLTSHWLLIFNIRFSSCPFELRTDLIFLWNQVSSVTQTLSVAHIKGKMSNLLITYFNVILCGMFHVEILNKLWSAQIDDVTIGFLPKNIINLSRMPSNLIKIRCCIFL